MANVEKNIICCEVKFELNKLKHLTECFDLNTCYLTCMHNGNSVIIPLSNDMIFSSIDNETSGLIADKYENKIIYTLFGQIKNKKILLNLTNNYYIETTNINIYYKDRQSEEIVTNTNVETPKRAYDMFGGEESYGFDYQTYLSTMLIDNYNFGLSDGTLYAYVEIQPTYVKEYNEYIYDTPIKLVDPKYEDAWWWNHAEINDKTIHELCNVYDFQFNTDSKCLSIDNNAAVTIVGISNNSVNYSSVNVALSCNASYFNKNPNHYGFAIYTDIAENTYYENNFGLFDSDCTYIQFRAKTNDISSWPNVIINTQYMFFME